MASFYEALGFKRSPFFREALEPTAEDYAVFTGRVDDLKRILSILNPDAGVHLITGMRGVGKTTFVNAIQYLTSLEEDKIKEKLSGTDIKYYPTQMLPCYRKIQLEDNDTVDKVLLKVISSIIFSVDQFSKHTGYQNTDPISEERSEFKKMFETNIKGADERTDHNTKFDLLVRIIASTKNNLKREGIYLVIDNLDIVETTVYSKLLNELRDYLFISGLCIIMLGTEGLYSDLRSTDDGVRIIDRITGQENILKPLSVEETLSILEARRHLLALDQSNDPPIPLDIKYIKKLYEITGGQIRLLFKLCEMLCISIMTQFPSLTVISEENAKRFLKEVVAGETRIDDYSKKEKEFLEECLKRKMRPKDYKDLKLDSGMHFIRIANKLIKDDLITKEVETNATYYTATGLLKLCKHVNLI